MKETFPFSISMLSGACKKFNVGNDLNVVNQVLENMVTAGFFYRSGYRFFSFGLIGLV